MISLVAVTLVTLVLWATDRTRGPLADVIDSAATQVYAAEGTDHIVWYETTGDAYFYGVELDGDLPFDEAVDCLVVISAPSFGDVSQAVAVSCSE